MGDSAFHGSPLGYAIGGFDIIAPGQTKSGDYYCLQPLDDAVDITTAVNHFGGNLNGLTIRSTVFGRFKDGVTISANSSGTLLAYKTN